MIPLYYSVLLYLIPAFLASNTWIGASIFIITPLAVLNHAKFHEEYSGKRIIMLLDRICSHAIAIGLCFVALQYDFITMIPFWICLVYTATAFHLFKSRATTEVQRRNIHVSMHAISTLGILWIIYIQSHV